MTRETAVNNRAPNDIWSFRETICGGSNNKLTLSTESCKDDVNDLSAQVDQSKIMAAHLQVVRKWSNACW
jgi:hypothetical protein